jgi:hypothetical protein
MKQQMIQHVLAAPGRGNRHLEVVLNLLLTHVVVEPAGPQINLIVEILVGGFGRNGPPTVRSVCLIYSICHIND